jgi:hypothetical protein
VLLAGGLAIVLAAGWGLAAFVWTMAAAKLAHITLLFLFSRHIGARRARV